MNKFFVSDTHYGHRKIMQLCNRPFGDIKEMEEAFLEAHNAIVKPGDEVYFLGDFAFVRGVGGAKEIERLASK